MEIPEKLEDWTDKTIEQFVKEKFEENQQIEYKEIFKKEGIQETICAFANASGGYLIFGIKHKKEKSQIKELEIICIRLRDEPSIMVNQITNGTTPIIQTKTKIIEINGKKILLVQIPEGKDKPIATQKGCYYIRLNGQKMPLDRKTLADWFTSRDIKQQRRSKLVFEIDHMLKTVTPKLNYSADPKFHEYRGKELVEAIS